ncbi:alpha/beta hydrolase [Acidovorax sp.]|uniref:alpha/beta fold hydrolase n=1 Tax=Acidovorax sp. TaxID=1872122 RepID=UPI0025C27CD9|nr:alpha/beta hydrolase [Acidovorax sp.]MBL7087475.1 alpha/beta hydrolase [Acidovorax sp.]
MSALSPRQWILLRGLTREAAHWGAFAEGFSQAVPGDQVLALDLPGNGEFHRLTSPLSVQGMVQACRAELARRAIAPPYHLLAMSLGAMVATEWARVAPHEVAGCVLINTSLRPFSPFWHRLRVHNLVPLMRLARLWRSAEPAEEVVWQITSRSASPPGSLVAQWAAVRRLRPVSAHNALRQLVAAARYRAPAAAPADQVLLLGSLQDQLVSSLCSQAIARAWGLPLQLHPWAGHDLPLDDPQWVIDAVLRWLSCGGATAG